MDPQRRNWINATGIVAAVLASAALLVYSIARIQTASEESGWAGTNAAGFFRWLLGLVFLLAVALLTGWLNFRYPFRLLFRQGTKGWYVAWHFLLTFLLFRLFEYRTDFDPALADENLVIAVFFSLFLVLFVFLAEGFRTKREARALLQQKSEAELKALKAQVNPHFLFNALNTIYSQTLQGNVLAAGDAIQNLSFILRFTLVQAEKSLVSLDEEIDLLEKFVALHKARLPEPVREGIVIDVQYDEAPVGIAPLLLLPFIENAIQYAIQPGGEGYVHINLEVSGGQLLFRVRNSINQSLRERNKGTGQGLQNVRQRLAIAYPGRHRLSQTELNGEYSVSLEIVLDKMPELQSVI